MIEFPITLTSGGSVCLPGHASALALGYAKNKSVYRLAVTATGEWAGLTIRAFWHVPGGSDPASTLVVDGYVAVPASVTAQPGSGCITFEGSGGTKTVTSADLRYRVSANSGTADGTMPEPGTPAWQELVDTVQTVATAAEQAKTDAQTAAQQAGQALSDTITAKEDALKAIGDKQTSATTAVESAQGKALDAVTDAQDTATQAVGTVQANAIHQMESTKTDALKAIGDKQTAATQAVDAARDKALQQVEASTEAAQTAASEAATSAGDADRSAQEAAGSLQELKDGIANGNFKGEPGNDGKSPVVTVTDIENGHRVSITDKDGTKTIDVLNGQAGKDGTQIDDATVGLDAWSSKHIVDMLCPPLEETGNPAQCYPVVGYPWGVKAEWEPMQDGSGTQSPENIRPIKGRDSVTVERCGENLLKLAEEMPESDCDKNNSNNTKRIIKPGTCVYGLTANNYLSASQVSNVIFFEGGVSFHSIATGYGIGIGVHLVPGARYKIFYVAKGDAQHNISFYDFTGTHINFTSEKNFEVPANAAYACVVFRASSIVNVDLEFKNVAIVLDGGAESYSPYTGQTATLTLPHTIYGGTVDAVTGEGNERWKLLTLDGTESWNTWGISAHNPAATGFYTYDINDYDRINVKGICSHLPETAKDVWGGRDVGIGFATVGMSYYFMYCVPNSLLPDISAGHEVASLKAYLAAQYAAGTPVQIAYKLAEPVPFTALSGAQPIHALPGVNTVITDADSVAVTGRADPIKRITDLEDAVASMT